MKEWHEYASIDEAITDYIERMASYGKTLNRTEARKEITKKIPLESEYQKKIIKYLRTIPNCKAWKENQGKYCSSGGIPDVTAVIGGRYYGFEVKRPLIGVASDIQIATINEINEKGGHAAIVVTVDDVKKLLDLWEVKV